MLRRGATGCQSAKATNGQPLWRLDLTDHFAVWMPFGRSYDIRTGKDWESSGFAPDIVVDPKLALVKTLELSGVSPHEAATLDAQEIPAEPVRGDKLRAR
jgi:hypothetical protein